MSFEMFSKCSNCEICAAGRFCLAGHGDNDYIPATKEQVIERLNNNKYYNYRENMIKYLKEKYSYDYKGV